MSRLDEGIGCIMGLIKLRLLFWVAVILFSFHIAFVEFLTELSETPQS